MLRKDLITEFETLSDESKHVTKIEKQKRGRKFEDFLRNLLALEGLAPRYKSFRPKGEELDGSFLFGHRVYLLEAKWHADPLPASSIYQFKGKVDGKLVGTIGVFISISGFSNDAIDALVFGKTLNVILFDGNDLQICLSDEQGFTKGLEQKLRAATELGLPFYSLNSQNVGRSVFGNDGVLKSVVIIVEGRGDMEIISFLTSKILNENNIDRKVIIREAGGKISIPRLANSIDAFKDFIEGIDHNNVPKFILIADADADIHETFQLLSKPLNEGMDVTFVIPDPEIEIWFQEFEIHNREDFRSYSRTHNFFRPTQARDHLLNQLNIKTLLEGSKSFNKFYNALIE